MGCHEYKNVSRKDVINIIKIFDEQTLKNIFNTFGLHFLFSLGFWISFLYFNEKFTIWSDVIGWISYLVVGSFIKVSERRIQNIISASFVTIVGILYWFILFSTYIQEMHSYEGMSFVGPRIIWIFYLPYVHGIYFILNQDLIDNVDLIPYVLLISNIGISALLYITIILKKQIRKYVRVSQGPFG